MQCKLENLLEIQTGTVRSLHHKSDKHLKKLLNRHKLENLQIGILFPKHC